jgi:hypothetical protein
VDCTADRDQVLEQSTRYALEAETVPTREGGKQEWVDMEGRKGERQEGGEGRRKKSRRYIGYTVTILKRKCRVLTGKYRTRHEQRKRFMLIVFFGIERIVRAEFVPRGTTLNSEYYKGLLERYDTTSDENGRKSGRMDLCCFMTTLRVTRLLSSASFLPIKK